MSDKAPAPDARHTQLVGLELQVNAVSMELKDARKAWNQRREEDVKPLADKLAATKRAKAQLLADVAQQWLNL